MSKYNRIPCEELLSVVRSSGLSVEEQAAYYKCTAEGTKLKVYVAKNKRPTRVYFSGFTFEHQGVKEIPRELAEKRNLGSFQSQLDFTQDTETVLEALRVGCETVANNTQTTEEQGEWFPVEGSTEETTTETTVQGKWTTKNLKVD